MAKTILTNSEKIKYVLLFTINLIIFNLTTYKAFQLGF